MRLITCRVCKKSGEPSAAISDVCVGCVGKADQLHKGFGDRIAEVTKALGIPTCAGCARRQAALNKVDMDAPLLEIAKGLWEAIVNPEDEDGST